MHDIKLLCHFYCIEKTTPLCCLIVSSVAPKKNLAIDALELSQKNYAPNRTHNITRPCVAKIDRTKPH